MDDLFRALEQAGDARCLTVTDAASGLRAFIVLDDHPGGTLGQE
jgi:hypothetical protein